MHMCNYNAISLHIAHTNTDWDDASRCHVNAVPRVCRTISPARVRPHREQGKLSMIAFKCNLAARMRHMMHDERACVCVCWWVCSDAAGRMSRSQRWSERWMMSNWFYCECEADLFTEKTKRPFLRLPLRTLFFTFVCPLFVCLQSEIQFLTLFHNKHVSVCVCDVIMNWIRPTAFNEHGGQCCHIICGRHPCRTGHRYIVYQCIITM